MIAGYSNFIIVGYYGHRLQYYHKGLSKNVNIFMSVQTVHFSRPLPLQVYRRTSLVSKILVSRKTFIVQQQKINPYFKSV